MEANKSDAGAIDGQDSRSQKRSYRSPELVAFGRVSELTRGAAGSNTTDGNNASCTIGGTKTCMVVSDQRCKENIVRIGDHPLGIGLYLFDYKPEYRETCGHGRQFGVMAQEVERVMPEAVCVHPDGYKMVDYGMLGIRHFSH